MVANETKAFIDNWSGWMALNESESLNMNKSLNLNQTVTPTMTSSESWLDLSEEDKNEFLFNRLGPVRLDLEKSVALTFLYAILFVVGCTGNFLTCIIILCNSYMRVPPNFFLFSLAIADIVTLMGGT